MANVLKDEYWAIDQDGETILAGPCETEEKLKEEVSYYIDNNGYGSDDKFEFSIAKTVKVFEAKNRIDFEEIL